MDLKNKSAVKFHKPDPRSLKCNLNFWPASSNSIFIVLNRLPFSLWVKTLRFNHKSEFLKEGNHPQLKKGFQHWNLQCLRFRSWSNPKSSMLAQQQLHAGNTSQLPSFIKEETWGKALFQLPHISCFIVTLQQATSHGVTHWQCPYDKRSKKANPTHSCGPISDYYCLHTGQNKG